MQQIALKLVFTGLWTLFAYSTQLHAKSGPVIDFSLLEPFYQREFGHSLRLITPTDFTLRKNRLLPLVWSQLPDAELNTFFSFDPFAYTTHRQAKDFLSAKRSFYDNLNFSKKEQNHHSPLPLYFYWNGLFHPPLQESEIAQDLQKIDATYTLPLSEEHLYLSASFQENIDELSNSELSFGNQLTLLKNNESIAKKISMVKQTKDFFYASVMVFACGKKEEELARAMVFAATQGKDIRLIIEGLYSPVFSKCLRLMKEGGVKVAYSKDTINPKNPLALFHNKLWIQDGKYAIIGGQNMTSSQNKSTGLDHYYRDTDVFFQGPVVKDLLLEYLSLWKRHKKKNDQDNKLEVLRQKILAQQKLERQNNKRGISSYPTNLNRPLSEVNGACRMIFQGPNRERRTLGKVYSEYLQHTKKNFFLTSPIIRFNKKIITGEKKLNSNSEKNLWPDIMADHLARNPHIKGHVLSNASLANGADITVALWDLWKKALNKNQHALARLISKVMHRFAKTRSKANIEHMSLLRRETGLTPWYHFSFSHQKLAIFDGIATSIGSFNLDVNSSKLNYEMTMICIDPNFQSAVDAMLLTDLANSIPVPRMETIR